MQDEDIGWMDNIEKWTGEDNYDIGWRASRLITVRMWLVIEAEIKQDFQNNTCIHSYCTKESRWHCG